jgi:hypothetical protein
MESIETFMTNSFGGENKTVILDEIDSMLPQTQIALTKVMDKYPMIRVICICNYLRKIQPRLKSRCNIQRFDAMDYDTILDYLMEQGGNEHVELIAKRCRGDLREGLYELENTKITGVCGYPTDEFVMTVLNDLINGGGEEIYNWVERYPLSKLLYYLGEYIITNGAYEVIPKLNSLEEYLLHDHSQEVQIAFLREFCLVIPNSINAFLNNQ